MSANVESLFYNGVNAQGFWDERKVPWHGLGTAVAGALKSDEALKMAGLDWDVLVGDAILRTPDGQLIETEEKGTYRSTDLKPLGVVSDQYTVVQNRDAFAFTDALIATGDVTYETAGSLDGGKKVFLLANLPEVSILGDAVVPYILFSNSHDGSSAVRVTATPVRVVCQNTLNMALSGADRIWSFVHRGDIESKIHEAQMTLSNMKEYIGALNQHAEILVRKRISSADMKLILDQMFPVPEEDIHTKTKLNNLVKLRNNFFKAYDADDLADFKGTAWGVMNAFSDMIYHGGSTLRTTPKTKENRLLSVMNGNALFDRAHEIVLSVAA